jgi:hypothetical protein
MTGDAIIMAAVLLLCWVVGYVCGYAWGGW